MEAPERVRAVYRGVSEEQREAVPVNEAVLNLAQSYLDAGVVGAAWREDCIHVAAATVARADAIVFWNFKHIVRLDRIHDFNSVNLREGYGMIMIISSKEVSLDE